MECWMVQQKDWKKVQHLGLKMEYQRGQHWES
jgi:hypothetical protein